MKMYLQFTLILLLAGSIAGQDGLKTKVMDLDWISGCWEVSGNGSTTIERWGKPSDNLMIGTSQTTKGTRTVSFEFLRIASRAEGLEYIARPSQANGETAFAAVRGGAKEIIFENPKHDFPQRIIYKQEKPGTLSARIEGPMNGKNTAVDFKMLRIGCD